MCGKDRRCRRSPSHGIAGGPCKLHGGNSLVGAASPAFKHGRFSAYLPGGMAQRFDEAMSDPGLLRCRDEIALLRVQIGLLLPAIDTAKPEAERQRAWREICRLISQVAKTVMIDAEIVRRGRLYLTIDECQTLFGAIATAVKTEVTDRNTLARINARFKAILHRREYIDPDTDGEPPSPTPATSGVCHDAATL